jgi:hypothetical protein
LKKVIPFLFVLIFAFQIKAQVGYVEASHPIYQFLERMNVRGIISSYNSFELPKSRKEIGKWLKQIGKHLYKLNSTDKEIFRQFKSEFEYEYSYRADKYYSLIGNGISQNYPFSSKEKYLYFYSDKNKSSFYVNLIGNVKFINRNSQPFNYYYNFTKNGNSALVNFGGRIGGTFYDKFGFQIKGTNGTFRGDKRLADTFEEAKFNYKFNETDKSNIGANYFDNTEGYAAYQNNWLQLKIGSDRNIFGEGIIKDILSDNSPRQNYFSMKLNYKSFSYSFYHAKLMGLIKTNYDNDNYPYSPTKIVSDKNFVYHRFGLHIGNSFFNAGEMVIYSFREFDLAYINPFNFYKSSEHANQDRDNSLLFFDFSNYSLKDFKFFGSIIIDDLDFSKIGTHWFGNQLIYNFGFYSTVLNKYIPVDFELQYLRFDPYVYTHRFMYNNYTNAEYNLGAPLQPNSHAIALKMNYTPTGKLKFDFTFVYSEHGEDIWDNGGGLNVGGNIWCGHRKYDSPDAKFLSGKREYLTHYELKGSYEFINNYFLFFKAKYLINKDFYFPKSYFDLICGLSLII